MSYNILTRSISWVLDFIRGEPTPRRRSDRTTLRSEGVQHVGQRTEGGGCDSLRSPRLPRRREARGPEPSIPHPLAKLLEEVQDHD